MTYLRRRRSIAFVCLLFTFLAGCAGVTIKDDLPASSPKGYADFAKYSLDYDVIYSLHDGRRVKEGALANKGEVLRLARTPGNYEFLIKHRDDKGRESSELVNVKVMENMLTFITIDNKIVDVESRMREKDEETLITYNLKISVADTPIPASFESEPNKTGLLINLLGDPDWRTRLYAIGLLVKMGTSRDEGLLTRVKTMATDDPHRSVRKKAAEFSNDLGMDVFKDVLLLENFEFNNRTWISSRGHYDFFYNDEFLLSPGEGVCENEMSTSPLDLPRDFDVEWVSAWRSGTAGNEYGILIGSDEHNFDHFGISGQGRALVRPVRNNELSADLIPWTDVPAIKKDGTAANRLRVEARGAVWKYYVNDAYVGEIANTLKPEKYVIGLRVCPGQAVAFEQLKISRVRKN